MFLRLIWENKPQCAHEQATRRSFYSVAQFRLNNSWNFESCASCDRELNARDSEASRCSRHGRLRDCVYSFMLGSSFLVHRCRSRRRRRRRGDGDGSGIRVPLNLSFFAKKK